MTTSEESKAMESFGEFWKAFPRRVGKIAAQKEYLKALKRATPEEILAGVEAYKQHMPQEARFQVHPRTFLSQGRWLDEYPDQKQRRQPGRADWFTECRQLHNLACGGQYNHAIRMDVERLKREAS